jgi:methionyl-tRNA synthetase
LGNLFSRVLAMIERYQGGILGRSKVTNGVLAAQAQGMVNEVSGFMEGIAFHRALGRIWDFIGDMNRLVDEKAPWALAKEKERKAELEEVLYDLSEGLRLVALHLFPFMPATASKMWSQLGLSERWEDHRREEAWRWGVLREGTTIRKGEALFPRLEKEVALTGTGGEASSSGKASAAPPTGPKRQEGGSLISLEEFARLDLRVAQIVAAEPIKGSKKLIRLKVDLGSETRTLVAGIAQTHKPEDLRGKKVVVVANLAPAKLMGIESQGMILAASGDQGEIVLVVPEADIPPGARVK